ncbi:MAG: TrmH family RNA methyltransferase [bacterium]|nr:TrmH family RNA methyltransferase [bacterium]
MKNIFLALHNIRSMHNVGAIFRTADAMGIKKIYLTGYTPEPYDLFGKLRKDFAKTALGAEKYVAWEKTKNINSLIKKLKSEKVFIIALEQSKKSISLGSSAFKSLSNRIAKFNAVLILGNEVRGIPKSVLLKSDAILEIPMLGRKESLNVSVAAGIALYSLRFC